MSDEVLVIGFEEDGVLWVGGIPDASAAEDVLADYAGRWRAIRESFMAPLLAPNGLPYGGGDEEWIETGADARQAVRSWRLVNVEMPEIFDDDGERWTLDGEWHLNPYFRGSVA